MFCLKLIFKRQKRRAFNMDMLKDVIKYFYINYPQKGELSKARLVKMIYLSDWKSCLLYEKQITNIHWFFNNYGPYVSEIINEIRTDSEFEIKRVSNMYGESKELVFLKNGFSQPSISNSTKSILDFVIEKTYLLNWTNFISLVYSTYPVVKQHRYSYFNLVELAKEYLTQQDK